MTVYTLKVPSGANNKVTYSQFQVNRPNDSYSVRGLNGCFGAIVTSGDNQRVLMLHDSESMYLTARREILLFKEKCLRNNRGDITVQTMRYSEDMGFQDWFRSRGIHFIESNIIKIHEGVEHTICYPPTPAPGDDPSAEPVFIRPEVQDVNANPKVVGSAFPDSELVRLGVVRTSNISFISEALHQSQKRHFAGDDICHVCRRPITTDIRQGWIFRFRQGYSIPSGVSWTGKYHCHCDTGNPGTDGHPCHLYCGDYMYNTGRNVVINGLAKLAMPREFVCYSCVIPASGRYDWITAPL